jgi:PBSX family phage terminase large subunit
VAGKVENLKPFTKGDPRINRKGRPKSFDALRELAQQIAHEAATKDRAPLVIDGHIVTITEAILRQWAQSKDARLQMAFVEAAYGKTPPPMDPALAANSTDEQKPITIPADLIAPDFFASHRAIHSGKYTEFVEKGGRGSTKSSFISAEIIELLVNDPEANALATRQVKDTLRDSVYAQLVWAIEMLGLTDKFKCTTSPLEMEYLPTGQQIFFRGADDPGKIKSIKPKKGAIKILWFEELDSFRGPEVVRNIEQSAIRGTDTAYIFKSFNPPRTAQNWANKYCLIPKEGQWQHSSNYLGVPIEWLGKVFVDEAKHLQEVNPEAYDHEYLGVPNFAGGSVFQNIELRAISDEEISQFDHIGQGIDWGWYPDPFAWTRSHYDPARMTLYIFDEYRANRKSNEETYRYLFTDEDGKHAPLEELIIADSAEEKSVGDYKAYGANIKGAEKNPGSRNYSYKWLQSRLKIVIDPVRAPYSASEFSNAEYPQDKDGNYINEYPEHDDHFIDSTRYRTNLVWRRRGQ